MLISLYVWEGNLSIRSGEFTCILNKYNIRIKANGRCFDTLVKGERRWEMKLRRFYVSIATALTLTSDFKKDTMVE